VKASNVCRAVLGDCCGHLEKGNVTSLNAFIKSCWNEGDTLLNAGIDERI